MGTTDIMIELKDVSVSFYVQRHSINNLKDFILKRGFAKPFEENKILTNVNLSIYKGETFGLIGKNGSGKSTLLRTIAGIIKPEKGEVNIYGKVAPMLAIGVGLEPELTGLENIKLCSVLMGRKKKEIANSIDKIIEFSELTDHDIGMQVKRYSSGMLSRLSFSITVAETPEILIIDEALAVGDIGFQEKCATRINEIRLAGCTTVYVSHHFEDLRRICSRVACMGKGVILKVGTPDEVDSFYKQQFSSH